MADIELVIKIDKDIAQGVIYGENDAPRNIVRAFQATIADAIKNSTPLTPDVLADLLMEERIRGELKQDISYSKEVIDDVRCRLTVDIIDRRPCYCGAELREVWRESEG